MLVDSNNDISVYSIDEHFPLRPLVPKSRIVSPQRNNTDEIVSFALAATPDEKYIYYLSTEVSVRMETEYINSKNI